MLGQGRSAPFSVAVMSSAAVSHSKATKACTYFHPKDSMLKIAMLLFAQVTVAQVATCPTAVPGPWATGTFLPCTAVVYVAMPVPATAIVSDLRGAVGSWQLASSVLPTDQVWAQTTAVPAGTWVSGLTVASPIGSTATLSWTAPTLNTDGSALTNLASYNIYQGATKLASVLAPATSYVISGLAPGTYTWTVTAVNSAAAESAPSTPATGTVTPPVVVPSTPQAPGSVSVTITVSLP